MSPRLSVEVHRSIEYDEDIVRQVLGEAPLPVAERFPILAPFITIDGRIHRPTSDFLRHRSISRPNMAGAVRIASDLASWLRFLVNDCGLPPLDDSRDPVLAATEDHFATYYRKRQYGTVDEALSSEGWKHASSAIKRLYEWMRKRYNHEPPVEIVTFSHRDGWSGTTIANYQARRRSTGSAGIPLTPEFAELLLMGALRVDLDGRQDEYLGADRDHALISLGLATGMRRRNLANITTYEIPALSRLPVTTIRVADMITKNSAGGDAMVFTHRLPAVHDYMAGARTEIVRRTQYKPRNVLRIISADAVSVRYRPAGMPDAYEEKRWSDLDDEARRRLVTPDGHTPILFVNEYTGAPLSYSSYQHVVAAAAAFVRARIDPDFPDQFRMHDLRHTYAVHLTIVIYRGVIADAVAPERREDWVVDHVGSAVEMVKGSLGHASESSTTLYIQTAFRFLTIPQEQFTGDI